MKRIREPQYPPPFMRQSDRVLEAGEEVRAGVWRGLEARVEFDNWAFGHHYVKTHDLAHVAFGAPVLIKIKQIVVVLINSFRIRFSFFLDIVYQ